MIHEPRPRPGIGNRCEPRSTYWSAVEKIFEALADLDQAAARRRSMLAAPPAPICAPRSTLLEADARAGGSSTTVPTQMNRPTPPPGVGRTIGPFRLVTKVGSGGMGAIYLAERPDGGFAQRVAVKIITTPITTREPPAASVPNDRSSRRYAIPTSSPCWTAGSRRGPGLSRDGVRRGGTDLAYCADRTLSLADRLRLIRKVCGAVHHAHHHCVVHRDLKPSNILVTPTARQRCSISEWRRCSILRNTGGCVRPRISACP